MNSSSPRSIDTEQEINELYAALDERDQHIRRLEELLEEKSSRHDEEALAVKDSQLNEYRDELLNSRNVVADLQIQIKCLREDNLELKEDKEHLEEEVSAHRSQADTLRSQLTQYSKAADEVKRLRKDGNQQLQRLELENQRLRTTVNELEQNENVLCNEIDTLVEEKSENQGKYEDLLAKCDSLYAELDEATRNTAELSELTHKLTADHESERSKNAKTEALWQKRWADCTLKIKKLTEELELERGKETSKEYEANKIELAKLRHETQHLRTSHKQLVKDKHHAERDLDAAIKALNDSKANVKEEVALVARKEQSATADLKRQLKCSVDRCSDLEQQLEEASNRLEQSELRNARYEENHGLKEAVRHQKKLEADVRRREYDIKQLNQKLSSEIEHRRVLRKAIELMKDNVNLVDDFEQLDNDEEIRAALRRDDNVLQSENEELLRQVEYLEVERTKLLTRLRERAIEIGENGTRFLGMDPLQMGLVLEFASNIKNGTTDLPLNDRSKELMSQIAALKSESEVDKVTIERLEREIFLLAERNACISSAEIDVENKTKPSTPNVKGYAQEGEEAQVNSNDTDSLEQPTQQQNSTHSTTISVNDLPICAPFVQQFRRGSLLASEKNERLLRVIAQSEQMLGKLADGNVSSESTKDCIANIANDEDRLELIKRLLYLEEWKTNAMNTIESQIKSSTVCKTTYEEVLYELDNLKRDNILLVEKLANCQVTLMKQGEVLKAVDSNATPNDRIKALSAENLLLHDRIAAYEEREHSMKRSMDDAISEYQHIKSEYAGMKEDNDRLKSELIEAKHIADLSASQASALLSMNAKGMNIDDALVGPSYPAILASSSVELESRLSRAQNQVLMLQNTCKTLVSLVQKITRYNWYRHAPINQGFLELSNGMKAEHEINLSAASKIKELIETHDSLESKLRENEAEIETLKHEKDLLETRLSRTLNRNCEPNDLLNQLTETKSKLFTAQRELRHSSHQIQLLEAKNNILERSNSHLEKNAANAELLFVNGQHPHLDIISSFVSFQSGECNEEKDKAEDVLKKVASNLSHYVAEMKNVYSVVSSLRAHRVESIQISCLDDLVNEKDRMIISLKQKLTQAKHDLQNVNGAPRHKATDDSISSFRTIGSIANLAKCSPKRSFYEARLEEATELISRKDLELKDCSRQISELKEDNLRLSSRLEGATKQSELLKADISTLVSRLNGEESTIIELEKELSIQKQIHRDSIASLEQTTAENEKLKNQLINHAKKRKEIDARVNKLDNDLARTKRILSVARQGKARSEAMVKEISAKEETAREEVAKLQKELGDVKTKLLAATEDKVAASRKSRAATTKLKALTERFDPDAHEKIKDSLEQRVAVLNQTVSGLASQNSKLRSQLGILKKEQEENLETIKRQHTSKDRSSSRVRTCNQCKSHESRIASLEKLLASEKKISADNKQMLQMYQLRSSNVEEAPEKQNQEESKRPSPRPPSASKGRLEEMKKQMNLISRENEDLQVKLKQMTAARDKLSSQLEAFDLDFFEEIEDLKYKYNEAVRQLSELTGDH